MAAVTLLGTPTWTTTSGTKTVTATPAVGDLIVVVAAHSGNVSTAAPSDDNAAGTYALVLQRAKNSSADTLSVFVRDALIGAAVSTIFTHAPGTSTGGGLAVFAVSGMTRTGLGAILQSASTNLAAGSTAAPTFAATPQAGNPIIGALFNETNPATQTPPTGYSEECDRGYASPTSGLHTVKRDSGETSATITWGSTSSRLAAIVVEIDASAAGGDTVAVTTGTLALAGQTVNVDRGRLLAIGAGTLALAGQAVAVTVAGGLQVLTGTLAFAGQSVTIVRDRRVAISAGTLTLVGQAVAVVGGGGAAAAARVGGMIVNVGRLLNR